MKIAIFGFGYLGKAMAFTWQSLNHDILVFTRNQARLAEIQAFKYQAICWKDKNFKNQLNECHAILICIAPDCRSTYETTYLPTLSLILKSLEVPGKHIIYTSSTSVYGDHNGMIVDEETVPQPANFDAHILCQAEKKLLSEPNHKTCILRLGEIVGPHRTLLARLQKNSIFAGTGKQKTNIIHLNEIIAALDFSLIKGLNGLFNLCNDLHIERKELYTQICKQAGMQEVTWDAGKSSKHPGNKVVSNQKIKQAGFAGFLPVELFFQKMLLH